MNATAAAEVKAWLDTARTGYFIGKLVAADYAADSMAVVNFSASSIVAGGTTYTGAGYCARIAGILAATSIAASATYAPLEVVESVAAVADPDSAVDGGKLILLHDGRKAKIARAVNSLTTVPEGQSPALKKIKVVEAIDLIRSYAIRLTEDRYVGRKSNSYDNKLALVTELPGISAGAGDCRCAGGRYRHSGGRFCSAARLAEGKRRGCGEHERAGNSGSRHRQPCVYCAVRHDSGRHGRF